MLLEPCLYWLTLLLVSSLLPFHTGHASKGTGQMHDVSFCPSIRRARLWLLLRYDYHGGGIEWICPTWRSPVLQQERKLPARRVNVGPTLLWKGEASQASPWLRSLCHLCSIPKLPSHLTARIFLKIEWVTGLESLREMHFYSAIHNQSLIFC